jgi:epoxyqueuosine reductase QueG
MRRHEELAALLEGMGASFIGFADVAGKAEGSFQNLPYAVSVGIRLSDSIVDEISDQPTFTYFHHYRSVNAFLDQLTLRGLVYIQRQGFNAVAVPASQTVNDGAGPYRGVFPHKTAAVRAGLGRIGKNGLFLHRLYGPRVRIATILTDMELPFAQPLQDPGCGSCRRCVDACPALALTGGEWHEGAEREELVDAKACSEYMNRHFKQIGRGSVCGICMRVCPRYGKDPVSEDIIPDRST